MSATRALRASVLVTGGARSGKSRYALARALAHPAPRAFIATAETRDGEMAARIALHRAERGGDFATIEEPLALGDAVARAGRTAAVVVVDCVTVWVANLLAAAPPDAEVEAAIADVAARIATSPAPTIVVTNEVGSGIIPFEAETRRYRDVLGTANQRLAEAIDEVVLMVAGRPLFVPAR